MNQGKIIVGVAVLLGICAGLAGYWWNYRVGHRAIEFWGKDNARLIRLAPKVQVFELIPQNHPNAPTDFADALGVVPSYQGTMLITKMSDISQARGLLHLRNAILSDDQYDWTPTTTHFVPQIAIEFKDDTGQKVCLLFDTKQKFASQSTVDKSVVLGPLAKSLEQFLARELPRAEQDAGAKPNDAAEPKSEQPVPAKSE